MTKFVVLYKTWIHVWQKIMTFSFFTCQEILDFKGDSFLFKLYPSPCGIVYPET